MYVSTGGQVWANALRCLKNFKQTTVYPRVKFGGEIHLSIIPVRLLNWRPGLQWHCQVRGQTDCTSQALRTLIFNALKWGWVNKREWENKKENWRVKSGQCWEQLKSQKKELQKCTLALKNMGDCQPQGTGWGLFPWTWGTEWRLKLAVKER